MLWVIVLIMGKLTARARHFATAASVYGRALSKASTQTNHLSDLQLYRTLLQWKGQTYVESSNSETAKDPASVVENRIVRLRSWKKD